MNTALIERVERGVALLDAHGPDDWRGKINVADLDMIHNCVLDQLYPSTAYESGYVVGLGVLRPWLDDDTNGVLYGFGSNGYADSSAPTFWTDLRAAWIEVIARS